MDSALLTEISVLLSWQLEPKFDEKKIDWVNNKNTNEDYFMQSYLNDAKITSNPNNYGGKE